MSTIDLHMHSNISSDGDFSPSVLMGMCAQAGLKVVSLTDHNSTSGIAEARQKADELGLTLIPGIEMDCVHQGTFLHLLGYWIDPEDPAYAEIEASTIAMEASSSRQVIRKIKDLGIALDHEALAALSVNNVVTGEMIAEVALAHPSNSKLSLLLPYRTGGKRSDNPLVNFYYDFCAPGKVAYEPIQYMELTEAITVIQRSGGVPILAHPGINVGINYSKLESIIKTGVLGLEAYSSYHSSETTAYFLAQASLHDLAVTCGSDFHGKTKPTLQLGGVSCFNHEADILKRLNSLRPKS